MKRVLCTRFCVVAFGVAAVACRADDWTQFRGPKRDAVSQEKNLLKTWPKDGPKLLLRQTDVGYGFGSVAVAGGRIYLIGNKGLENEFVSALNAKDGMQLWSTRLGKVGNPDQRPNYPAARSTPTLDGKLVYALGSDGDLVCVLAATGKEQWRKSLRADFGGQPGVWAYAESPLVDGDKLIVTPGGEQATIVALNKKNGAPIWKTAIPGGDSAGYASAVVVEIGGVRQVVQFLQKGLVGMEAATGKFLWRFDKTVGARMSINTTTPICVGDQVYIGSGKGGHLAQLKSSGGTFSAEQVYLELKAPTTLGGSVTVGAYLYGTTGTALLCTEYATGKVMWEDRSVGAASILYADGRLYLHGENGEFALVEAAPEGYKELARFTPPDVPTHKSAKAWNYPVISNGKLYIRDLGSLWVYDIQAK